MSCHKSGTGSTQRDKGKNTAIKQSASFTPGEKC